MFIDTHCHISSEDYDDIEEVIKEDFLNDVDKIIISGCTKESIKESLDIVNNHKNIYLTIGYHPSEVNTTSDNDIEELKNIIKTNNIIGIGEIGLDYYYGKDDIKEQLDLFNKQLKLAEELDLPVVIHSRDAVKDTIDTLKKYNVKGIIHCFSGSVETAKEYISMGYLIGIGGVVTFKNSNLYKVVEEIGLDNIVLETDSPYLAPVPYRGKKNSSKYLKYVAEKIAEILDVPVEEVGLKTTRNANNLFDLNK